MRLIDPVDNTYGVYAKASVTIINSSIYAGDSPASSTGIYTEGYLTLRGTEVIASGASNGTGIQVTDVSESNIVANISNSSINVYGRNSGDTCVGLAQAGVSGTTTKVFASRINVTNCATLELGVSNVNGTINLDGSRIESATDAITAPSGTVRVGATMLQGSLTGAGILCAVSYDQNYAALDTTCN